MSPILPKGHSTFLARKRPLDVTGGPICLQKNTNKKYDIGHV